MVTSDTISGTKEDADIFRDLERDGLNVSEALQKHDSNHIQPSSDDEDNLEEQLSDEDQELGDFLALGMYKHTGLAKKAFGLFKLGQYGAGFIVGVHHASGIPMDINTAGMILTMPAMLGGGVGAYKGYKVGDKSSVEGAALPTTTLGLSMGVLGGVFRTAVGYCLGRILG